MTVSKKNIQATLGYYRPKADGTPPAINDIATIAGVKDIDERQVVITDIRGSEDSYHLEENGFQVLHHVSSASFSDNDSITQTYYKEMETLLSQSTGAIRVFILSHVIRAAPEILNDPEKYLTAPQGPARRVHVDQTRTGAFQHINMMLQPDEVKEILSHQRWQLVNAWRPIKTIYKDPFAVTDGTTVPDSDIIPLKRVYPGGHPGENCVVTAGDFNNHKWYYVRQQRPDEVLIFKQFDSDPTAKTQRTPHSAFKDPDTEDMATRESIEIRAILCY